MMSLRAQMYERAREWLEDNQITRKEFRSMFNAQLDQEKGDQWQREGLFLEPSIQEQRATREAFAREVAQASFLKPRKRRKARQTEQERISRIRTQSAEEKIARRIAIAQFRRRKKFSFETDKRNRMHYRDLKTGRFTKYPRLVKKSSPSRVKKPRSVS